MSFFTGSYLRILTPETINGVYPKMGHDGRQTFKETHLPLSARPAMERLNRKLPDALKKKIEVVPDAMPVVHNYQTVDAAVAEQLRAKIEELEAQNAKLKAQPAVTTTGMFGNAGEEGTKLPASPKTAAVGAQK